MSSNGNSFLYLNSHKKKYFEHMKYLTNPKNPKYNGYILKETFFSPENIDIIQKQLVLSVYKQSRILIPFQNYMSLKIIMKYIFNQHSNNLPINIKEQIKELNKILVDEITPMLIENANVKLKYLEDSQNPYKLIDLPINNHMSGNKTLPSFTSTF